MIKTLKETIGILETDCSPKPVDKALEIFEDILTGRGIQQSQKQREAIWRSFKLYNNICESKLTSRYVITLPTGAGKTTTIISWCLAIDQLNLGYSVSIASTQVRELFTIREALIEQGINPDKIGMLYSEKQKDKKSFVETCPPSQTPESHQFLLVTHKRYEQCSKKKDYLHFNGRKRNIIFWDETFRKTESKCTNISDVRRVLWGEIKTLDDMNIEDPKDKTVLTGFLQNVIDELENHKDQRSESKELNINWDSYTENDLVNILKLLRLRLKKNARDVYDLCVHLLNKETTYLIDKKIVTVLKKIKDDIGRLVVLDASYWIDGISQLDKTIKPVSLLYPRVYPNLKVTHRACASGESGIKKVLGSSTR